jgi:hypothetical protein
MMSLLLKGRGRWAQVLKVHMGEAVSTLQLLLVAPLAKVTVPAPSKHINRMITMMTMKTFPWTRSQPLSLGPHDLLRPTTQMGILKKVDYTRGSHNMYKERYTDPALWQKEFDVDIRFWLKFNANWYESVILSVF